MSSAKGSEQRLLWTKKQWDSKLGKYKPMGQECYRCYDVRRKFYTHEDGRIASQAEVEEFKTNEEIKEQWEDLRRDRVTG